MEESIVCEHGLSGMHIAGTIFGFDCNACLLNMVEYVQEAVTEGIETGRLPELTILEDGA